MADEYDITKAFARIENELIASIIRNMDRHRAKETEEGFEWSAWQVEQLKNLDRYKRENQKKYKKQFQDINKQIKVLIGEMRDRGNMEQEIRILEGIKKGYTPKKVQKGVSGKFFEVNDRKLEALQQATTSDMQKAEVAVLRKANDDYRKAIFNAQVYANTGAGTYEKAVDMATKDMLSRGLNCVMYANGARHTLADYADMAIRTASKRAYLQGEGEKRQEWGVTTVIMAKRGNPCPKCLPFVGKVLIDDVWSGGPPDGIDPRTGKKYPLMSYAISKGLYHPRCKDSHTTYFPGISTADDTWTKKELEEIGLQNKQEARRQYAKRQEEKYERLAEYSLDPENKEEYARRAEEWKKQHPPGWRRQFMRQQETEPAEAKISTDNKFIPATTKAGVVDFGKHYSEFGDFSVNGDFKLEILNGFNEAADNVQKRFGRKLKIKGITRVKTGDGKYRQAAYNPESQFIVLKNSTMRIMQENAEKNFASGWNASKDKYGTFYHEIGHAVWEDLSTEARSEIKGIYDETKHAAYERWMQQGGLRSGLKQADIFGKELSRYGIENEKEFFSESFSQIMSGRMRPVSRRVNAVLQEKYARMSEDSIVKVEKDVIIKPDKIIEGHEGTPKMAEPGTVIDHLGNNGKTETRTFYGYDGYKGKDITNHDHGFPSKHPYGEHGEHAHEYEWDENGRLKNRLTREITEKERKENSDIL